jgi:predicted transcriptional regulator
MDAFERLLWWLFAGSTGASTRLQVLNAIKEQPRNAQQLSQLLQFDYTTVRHHLGVLEKNHLVQTEGDRYGKLYFVSEIMEANWQKLEEIVSKTQGNKK